MSNISKFLPSVGENTQLCTGYECRRSGEKENSEKSSFDQSRTVLSLEQEAKVVLSKARPLTSDV